MSRSRVSLQVSLGLILAIPLVVCAEEGAAARSSDAAAPVKSRLELAAAIGIIPTAPEAEKKPEVPVQPVEAAPPPVAQQDEPIPEESPPEESEGVTKTQILLGVGVAALLGALGSGGGGGSSSTPSH